jgi:hypothetical protein
MINAAGLKTVELLAREKIIKLSDAKEISGVPYIHVLFE